jgi:hypothetical protein
MLVMHQRLEKLRSKALDGKVITNQEKVLMLLLLV